MSDDGGGCIGIGCGLLLAIFVVSYLISIYWQSIIIVALFAFVVLIIYRFHMEMKEAIKAVGRGFESVMGWAAFEASKITTPEKQTGGLLMTDQNLSLEELQNRSVNWNEKVLRQNFEYIARQADAPIMVRSYWSFLRQKFDLNRRTRLSDERNKWLISEVGKYRNLLKLLQAAGDIQAFPLEQDNRMRRIELEKQQIELDFKDEAAEKEIQRLENELRKVKLKKEIEDLNKTPQEPPKQLSPEEIRKKKRQELKMRIQKINGMIDEVKNDSGMSEHERQIQLNQLERKKFDLNDQLLDLI